MIRRLIIKLFKLTDIQDIILHARNQEIDKAKIEMKEALNNLHTKMSRQHSLEMQSKVTEINVLIAKLNEYKAKEKQVLDTEYDCKMQIKQNIAIASEIGMEIKSFATHIIAIDARIDEIINKTKRHQEKLR